jgi:hypothetical protein|tara:strand:- start:284 stop:619 length:336 start_codon:yes stop_codon:yes gene_type:complete
MTSHERLGHHNAITPSSEYKSYVNSNKNVISAGSVSNRTEALAYRRARVEKLREFYSNLEWKSTLVEDNPEDRRKNCYYLEPTEKTSPFDDLDKLEKMMPKVSDYIQNYTE